jgi:DtxR family Mn-dependent transcriptional regulator
MDWQNVHDIAEELEHVSSPELISKLDEFLGRPKTDPHGDPIPDEKGKITALKQLALKDLPLRQNSLVSSVSNQTPEMMEMLNHYGIRIGSRIRVIRSFDFDGSLQIKIARKQECVISGMAAQNIYVYDN